MATHTSRSSTAPPLDPLDLGGLTVSDEDDLLDVERDHAEADAARRSAALRISAGKGSVGMPSDAPLAAMAALAPSMPRWRVFLDTAGRNVWVGELATHAQPSALISAFPRSLPMPGQSAIFVLQGLDQAGRDTGRPLTFDVSGDAPEVMRARALVYPEPAAAAPPRADGESEAARRMREREEAQLAALREEAQRAMDRAAAREREVADREAAERDAAIEKIRSEGAAKLQTQKLEADADRQRAKEERDAERQRAKEERDAERQRAKDERDAERERLRDERAREREEQDRRDMQAAQQYERDREREREAAAHRLQLDREYHARMSALSAGQSLENMATKGAALATALGINPGAILQKVLGIGGDDTAPAPSGMGEGAVAALAGLLGKVVETVGDVTKANMAAQAAQAQQAEVEVVRPRRPPMRMLPAPAAAPLPPKLPPVTPRVVAPDPVPAPVPVPVPVSPPTTPTSPELVGVPMPIQRKARIDLRSLANELRPLPEEQWQGKIIQRLATNLAAQQYLRSVGVRAAAEEAGLDPEQVDRLVAKAAALGMA